MRADFLIIGNPENRRVTFFLSALEKKGYKKVTVLPYLELLKGKNRLVDNLSDNTVIRLESPGENFLVEKQFIALGEKEGWISSKDILKLEYDKGRIYYPSQWYSGFKIFLSRLQEEAATAGKSVSWMNSPKEIINMFNKPYCQEKLKDNGIPVPKVLESIKSYEDLRNQIKDSGINRVFIKLAYSSSASGIAAYQINPKTHEEVMYSTCEYVQKENDDLIYNSLKIKRYTSTLEIQKIVDWICSNDAHIEEWIPKATYKNEAFDLRVVMINNKPCHKVVRLSKSPMTNLHLGNKRGVFSDLNFSEEVISKIYQTGINTSKLFPGALYAGIDILVGSGSFKPYVVDVNAFGDLLPGILFEDKDTYEFEIEQMINRTKDNTEEIII